MHGFSLVMIQLPIVSVSVGVQWSMLIFQPNNVQCILINQIILFLVDQCFYIVMWCWSPQIYKHAQWQLVKYMNWPDSLDYKIFWKLELPDKIFLKHYFVINDFSDIVSFKKRFIPHMELFFSIRALSSWYFNLEFLKTGHEWVLGVNIFWNGTFRFSKQEHQYLSCKLWFCFGSWTHMQLYSYMYNQTAWVALWLGLCTLL